MNIIEQLAGELKIRTTQAEAAVKLMDDGNTIPFIARYRKEAHGNLDEVQIGKIQDRLGYYSELEARKEVILKSIDEQGKLTDELRAKIEGCFVKTALEDLYQPYKPKRRTRATIAKEKGLEPLAAAIFRQDGRERYSGVWLHSLCLLRYLFSHYYYGEHPAFFQSIICKILYFFCRER